MTGSPDIAAIVLAAGKGSRMGSDLHKVLHVLAGKTMLGRVLDTLDALNAARRIVVVGAGRDQIHRAYPALDTVTQDSQLGTGHAMQVALPRIAGFDGVVLVLYGDVPLVKAQTMQRLCSLVREDAALAVLGFRPKDPKAYGRLVTDGTGALERIVEYSDATEDERAIGFCNSGILAGRAEVMRDLLPQLRNDNARGEYYLTDIVALARAAGHRIATAEADTLEVTGVNSRDELDALERMLAEHADG